MWRQKEKWFDENMDNGVLPLLIGKLRVGKHEDACHETKALWQIIGLDLIPSVVTVYKKNMQLSVDFSTLVTKAQEAMVLWLLKVCYEDWVKEWRADKRAMDNNSPIEKRTKPKGQKNFSNLHAKAYKDLLNAVDAARKNENTGKGWDEALKGAAEKRYNKNQNGTGGSVGEESLSRKKPRLVFDIVDGSW